MLGAELPLAGNVLVLQVQQRLHDLDRVLGGYDLLLAQHDVVSNGAPHVLHGHVFVNGDAACEKRRKTEGDTERQKEGDTERERERERERKRKRKRKIEYGVKKPR